MEFACSCLWKSSLFPSLREYEYGYYDNSYVNCFLNLYAHSVQFSSVQSLSRVQLFVTPWIAVCQASLSITISQSSLKLTSIKLVMPSGHLILCHPLFLLPQSLPASVSFPRSQHFSWGSQSTGVSALASFLSKNTQGRSVGYYEWNDTEHTRHTKDRQDSTLARGTTGQTNGRLLL